MLFPTPRRFANPSLKNLIIDTSTTDRAHFSRHKVRTLREFRERERWSWVVGGGLRFSGMFHLIELVVFFFRKPNPWWTSDMMSFNSLILVRVSNIMQIILSDLTLVHCLGWFHMMTLVYEGMKGCKEQGKAQVATISRYFVVEHQD